ncbi:hypothetical protein PR048_030890 [Dryococelus australis]|uniref:Uncharacterized protein n=1 Tax=Dryococelus australis TaxID=614101 RepID=A0ABQ9GA67_9NEOP|nr:hypothetical protein PR048_030890 [Dryococelus australis]
MDVPYPLAVYLLTACRMSALQGSDINEPTVKDLAEELQSGVQDHRLAITAHHNTSRQPARMAFFDSKVYKKSILMGSRRSGLSNTTDDDNIKPGHSRIFASGNRMPLFGGFSRGSPVSTPFHSGAAPYSYHLTLIGSQDLVKSSKNLSTQINCSRPSWKYLRIHYATVSSDEETCSVING